MVRFRRASSPRHMSATQALELMPDDDDAPDVPDATGWQW
jgi:hypothetical protein